MPSITVRDASEADAEALAPLLSALGYPADPPTIARRLRALCAGDATGRVLVAIDDGQCVGFAVLHSTPVLHRPTPVGRVTGIAVLPALQGRGVGRELLRAAEAHFRAQGLERLEVTSGPLHAEAYPFYRRLGYEDQGVRFAKRLTSPS